MAQNATVQRMGVASAGAPTQQGPNPGPTHPVRSHGSNIGMPQSAESVPAVGAQFPGVDLSRLAGISPDQLAYLGFLFQTGQFPLPTHFPLSDASSAPLSSPGRPVTVQEPDIDMDKEDGELDDGDDQHTPNEQGFLRPPPTGPRNRTRSPYSLPVPSKTRENLSPNTVPRDTRASSTSTGTPTLDNSSGAKSAAEAFVIEIYRAGHSFSELAASVKSDGPLRRMYERLGLPLTDKAIAPPVQEPTGLGKSPESEHKAVSSKRPTPKTAPLQDRSQYLAKLQAAKKKKKPETSVAPAAAVTASNNPLPLLTTTSSIPSTGKQVNGKPTLVGKANTELIRQKLEALKAEQAAAKQQALRAANAQEAPSVVRPAAVPSPVALSEIKVTTGHNSNSGHVEPSFQYPLSTDAASEEAVNDNDDMLPGLFLPAHLSQHSDRTHGIASSTPNSGVAQSFARQLDDLTHTDDSASSTFQPPNLAKVVPRKRGVASDFYDDAAPSSSVSMLLRPFGRSHHQSADESLIITVSEDEDDGADDDDDEEGDEMDIDNSSDEGSGTNETRAAVPGSVPVDISSHRSLPQSAISSMPGTPSTRPPAHALERAEQELMNWKKRLAEAEGKRAASKIDLKPVPVAKQPPPNATQAPASAISNTQKTSALEAEKERLRRRLQELEQARLRGKSPVVKILNAQPDPVAEPRPDVEVSDTQTLKFDDANNNRDSMKSQSVSPSSGFSESDLSMQDQGLVNCMSEDANTSREAQPAQVMTKPTHTVNEMDSDTGTEKRATRPLESTSSNSNSEEEDDDLDDVYEQPRAALPTNRSLTSTQPTVEDAVRRGDIDMESTDNSSIEDNEDDDDLYEPASGLQASDTGNKSNIGAQAHTREEDCSDENPPSELAPSPERAPEPSAQAEEARRHFSAYESPLVVFKDYRYHPGFLESIPGGFKSLTYSHKIDPNQPLCPYESNGGKCNDKTCAYQHFSEMAITDNDLLKMMGTEHVPAKTAEDDKRWKAGLTEVVKQLRSTNAGKDVQAIAQRIAEFRREFINDPTRTLLLD